MVTLFVIFHVVVSICLVAIVLIQRGRGGGFVENLSGLESVFGTKTSVFLTRLTTVLATLFFLNCIILAYLSLRQSKSLMHDFTPKEAAVNLTVNATNATNPAGTAVKEEASKQNPQPQKAGIVEQTANVTQGAK